jgi:predicted nucleic acid-binding protein
MRIAKSNMTEKVFFDTDCISDFLCVGYESILTQLFKNCIVLPQQVVNEFRYVPYLYAKVNQLITRKDFEVYSIEYGTPESTLFLDLTSLEAGKKSIGKGEAAAIVLAKFHDGILGSNNLSDISRYVREYKLKHVTTVIIFTQAIRNGILNEGQVNAIWKQMRQKQRKLPGETYSEYLSQHT